MQYRESLPPRNLESESSRHRPRRPPHLRFRFELRISSSKPLDRIDRTSNIRRTPSNIRRSFGTSFRTLIRYVSLLSLFSKFISTVLRIPFTFFFRCLGVLLVLVILGLISVLTTSRLHSYIVCFGFYSSLRRITSQDKSGNNNKSSKNTSSSSTTPKSTSTPTTTTASTSSGGNQTAAKPKKTSEDLTGKLGKDGKLTTEERNRRISNNLCLFCGGTGHHASECKRAKARAAKLAESSDSSKK